MPRDGSQAECRQYLAYSEVDDQQSASGGSADACNQRPGAFLQAIALEKPDDRQDDPDDRDVAVLVEAVAQRGEHLQEWHSAEQASDDRRDRDDEQWVEPQCEADDDEHNPKKGPVIDPSAVLPETTAARRLDHETVARLDLGISGRAQHFDTAVAALDPVAARRGGRAAIDSARRHPTAIGEDVRTHRFEEGNRTNNAVA